MSGFRASQVYISLSTRRNLRVIAKSEGPETTVDEVADRLLSECISTRYPVLASLQKKVEDIESEMVEAVKSSAAPAL